MMLKSDKSSFGDDSKLLSWRRLWAQARFALPPTYDHGSQLRCYSVLVRWLGNLKGATSGRETQFLRLRVSSRLGDWYIDKSCVTEAYQLRPSGKGLLEIPESIQLYLCTAPSSALTLFFEVERLTVKEDGKGSQETVGWFSCEFPSIQQAVVPCRGGLLEFRRNGREEWDPSLMSVTLEVKQAKQLYECKHLIAPELPVNSRETVPGLLNSHFPAQGDQVFLQQAYTFLFTKVELQVAEATLQEIKTTLTRVLTVLFKNVNSLKIAYALKLSQHNGRTIVSKFEIPLARPIELTREERKLQLFKVEDGDLLNCVSSQQSVLAVQLIAICQVKYQVNGNPQAERRVYSCCSLLMQSPQQNTEIAVQPMRVGIYYSESALLLAPRAYRPRFKAGLIVARMKKDRPLKTEEPSIRQQQKGQVRLQQRNPTPSLLPAIAELEEHFIQSIELMRRQRDLKQQTMLELEKQLRQLEKSNPGLSSRIRVYFTDDTQRQQMESRVKPVLSRVIYEAEPARVQPKLKGTFPEECFLAQKYKFEGPDSPLSGSCFSLTVKRITSSGRVPAKISVRLKFFTFQRGKTEWLDVGEKGDVMYGDKDTVISFNIRQNVGQFKEYLKGRLLQLVVLQANSMSQFGFSVLHLKDFIRRRREEVSQLKDLPIYQQDFTIIGKLRVLVRNKKQELITQEPPRKVSLRSSYVGMFASRPKQVGRLEVPAPREQASDAQRIAVRISNFKIARLAEKLKSDAERQPLSHLESLSQIKDIGKDRNAKETFRRFSLEQVELTAIVGFEKQVQLQFTNDKDQECELSFQIEDPVGRLTDVQELTFKGLTRDDSGRYVRRFGKRGTELFVLSFLSYREQVTPRDLTMYAFRGSQFLCSMIIRVLRVIQIIDLQLNFTLGLGESLNKAVPVLSDGTSSTPFAITDSSTLLLNWTLNGKIILRSRESDEPKTTANVFFYEDRSRAKLLGCWKVNLTRLPCEQIELHRGSTKVIGLRLPCQLKDKDLELGTNCPWVKVRGKGVEMEEYRLVQVAVTAEQEFESVVSAVSRSTAQVVYRWLLRVHVIPH